MLSRWIVGLLVIGVTAVSSYALFAPEGTHELGLSGSLDFSTPSGTEVAGSVFYGYFVQDNLQLGGRFRMLRNDDQTYFSIGPRAEFDFDLGTQLVPFLAASLRLGISDVNDEKSTAPELGGEAGAKFYLTEYLAISGAFVLDLSTDKLYPSDDKNKRYDLKFELGLRVFF